MKKIVLIEDDSDLFNLLKYNLEKEGFAFSGSQTGKGAAKVSETDRILGLELGANDYIVKPFFIRELIARIKNQFRNQMVPVRTVRAGNLELDRTNCRVLRNGSEIAMTAGESVCWIF